MRIFKGENKKTFVVGDKGETPCQVKAAAKKRFKINEKFIAYMHGFIKGDYLYEQEVSGGKCVWIAFINRKVD